MCAVKTTIPDNISEEYYQISPDILASFPKYRPPLDLFKFNDDIAQLQPYSRKGSRLSKQQVEEINALCQDASLFVARSDHPVYSKHIAKQLDLILVDKNLKEKEIADILVQAFQFRLEGFFEQPVQPVFETLYRDIMVLTEYLSKDAYRSKSLIRRIQKEHTLANHSLNCGFVGLWLFFKLKGGSPQRRELDRSALAFFLHDMGMSKIPQFILNKSKPLTQEDRQKINLHPILGAKLAQKLGLTFNEIKACVVEHHERLDGSGYPRKTSGEEISKLGRMMAVVDSFCAMVADRPYAQAKEPLQAATELVKDSKHYDQRYSRIIQVAYQTGEF